MKKPHLHRSDKELLTHQLRLQGEVLKECLLMYEQGDSCVEVIKRIQAVELALSTVNAYLLNLHLAKCVATLSNSQCVSATFREISAAYRCLDKSFEKLQ